MQANLKLITSAVCGFITLLSRALLASFSQHNIP